MLIVYFNTILANKQETSKDMMKLLERLISCISLKHENESFA